MRTGERDAGASRGDGAVESSESQGDRRVQLARRRRVQRKQSGAAGATRIPEGNGARLPAQVAEPIGQRLGADLSSVNVHTGGESGRAAADLGARAFTVGSDVHFGAGQYAPGTKEGDWLIAHELTHVAQGQKSGVQRKAERDDQVDAEEVSHPDEPAEKEADASADEIAEEMHEQKQPGRKPAATRKPSAVSAKRVHLQPDDAAAKAEPKPDDPSNQEKGKPADQKEQDAVPGEIEAAMKRYTDSKVWPADDRPKGYKQPPKSYDELLSWAKVGNLLPEEKDYLYGMCEYCGLMAAAHAFDKTDEGCETESLDPRRTNIVAFALAKVGAVEAHTYSGEDEPGPKGWETVKKCVGADQLWDFYMRSGRPGEEHTVKDYRIRNDRDYNGIAGARRPAWCQVFSQWAVVMAGGDGSLDKGNFKPGLQPKPGDIAYMSDKDHMAVVIDVQGDTVTTVDGNTGEASGIVVSTRKLTDWNHGFYDSCPTAAKPQ